MKRRRADWAELVALLAGEPTRELVALYRLFPTIELEHMRRDLAMELRAAEFPGHEGIYSDAVVYEGVRRLLATEAVLVGRVVDMGPRCQQRLPPRQIPARLTEAEERETVAWLKTAAVSLEMVA